MPLCGGAVRATPQQRWCTPAPTPTDAAPTPTPTPPPAAEHPLPDDADIDTGCASTADELAAMTPKELLSLPAMEVARAVREGYVTSEELIKASIAQLQTETALYNNITTISSQAVDDGVALDEVLAKDGKVVGPLHGVPFVVGDNIHVRGFPTTCGSQLLADYYPSGTSPVVEVLQAAGAVVVAKGNMDEYGLGLMGQNESTGTIRNPMEPNYYAGGSQGGSVVSVVLGCVPFAIASDIQGDVRLPAANCGVIGFVPSAGHLSTKNTWMLSRTAGNFGVITRTVSDTHALNHIMRLSSMDEETRAGLCALPIPPYNMEPCPHVVAGSDHFTDLVYADINRSFRTTLAICEAQGIKLFYNYEQAKRLVSSVDKEHIMQGDQGLKADVLGSVGVYWRDYQDLLETEMNQVFGGICEKVGLNWKDTVDGITASYARDILEVHEYTTPEHIKTFIESSEILAKVLIEYWEGLPEEVQVVAFPTVATPPTKVTPYNAVKGMTEFNKVQIPVNMLAGNTLPFGIIGCPSITIPMGRSIGKHLVAGMLLVARPGADETLLSVAGTLDEMIKSGAAELARVRELAGDIGEAAIPDGPEWLEDRAKNGWALNHDMKMAVSKYGAVCSKSYFKVTPHTTRSTVMRWGSGSAQQGNLFRKR